MLIKVVFQILAALAVAISASPIATTSKLVVHERRTIPPAQWKRFAKLHAEVVFPVRIGLAQQNLHRAEEFINQVAHPASADYGNHWSRQKVIETFSPSSETITEVGEWLQISGIALDRVRMTQSRNWMTFNATTEEAERLLQTEYHLYKSHSGHMHVACDEYSLPEHLTEHIDIVTPTVHFDRNVGGPRRAIYQHDSLLPPPLRELNKRAFEKRGGILGSPNDQSNPKQGAQVINALMTLENCDTMITPACLQALYNTPPGSKAGKNNTLGVVEYTPQAFLQSDLNAYFKQFQPPLDGIGPNQNLIDGASVQTKNQLWISSSPWP